MNMFKKNGGFTLVELIVVIAILAILAGVAVPAYSGYIARANDAAVETELTAVSTAAMAANATAGEIESITVETDGAISVTADPKADDFAADFKTFYGYEKFQGDLTKSETFKAGAMWTPKDGWVKKG